MTRLIIEETPLSGLKRIERQRLDDERGYFERLFCAEELIQAGWYKPIVQINHSCSRSAGTVRGLHFQRTPHAEIKLVICLSGAVWDVVVDMRANSSTLFSWHGQELTAENNFAMLIPEGFAHGFQTLTDSAELLYLHSAAYSREAEMGICPLDEVLAIKWPRPITHISEKDANLPSISQVQLETTP